MKVWKTGQPGFKKMSSRPFYRQVVVYQDLLLVLSESVDAFDNESDLITKPYLQNSINYKYFMGFSSIITE